ncbi:hypothetical protein Ancab_022971 [Ancistrocladus abbreviatus]
MGLIAVNGPAEVMSLGCSMQQVEYMGRVLVEDLDCDTRHMGLQSAGWAGLGSLPTQVKNRTSNAEEYSSHVMQYSDINLSGEFLVVYMGATSSSKHQGKYTPSMDAQEGSSTYLTSTADEHQSDLVYLKEKWLRAPKGAKEKNKARNKLDEEMSHRKHVDNSIRAIGDILFSAQNGVVVPNTVRPVGKPLVDDWDCLKTMVKIYISHCGPLPTYGKKYMRAFANICNASIPEDHMVQASSQASLVKVCDYKKTYRAQSSIIIETLATRFAFRSTQNLDFKPLLVKTDALQVVHRWKNPYPDLKTEAAHLGIVGLAYYPRLANKVAHHLAKVALSYSNVVICENEFPLDISQDVLQDMLITE